MFVDFLEALKCRVHLSFPSPLWFPPTEKSAALRRSVTLEFPINENAFQSTFATHDKIYTSDCQTI